MAREKESEDIDACGDPAVVRILRVTAIHHVVKILQRGKIPLAQGEILHQRYTPNVEEDSHEKQLEYAPNGQYQTAQSVLRPANLHPYKIACAD